MESSSSSTQTDKDAIVRTLYNEARGEGEEGLRAAASTLYNRYRLNKEQFGKKKWKKICKKGYDGYHGETPSPNNPYDLRAYEKCIEIADELLDGSFSDTTKGCTHFANFREHFEDIEKDGHFEFKVQIRNHYFFKEYF